MVNSSIKVKLVGQPWVVKWERKLPQEAAPLQKLLSWPGFCWRAACKLGAKYPALPDAPKRCMLFSIFMSFVFEVAPVKSCYCFGIAQVLKGELTLFLKWSDASGFFACLVMYVTHDWMAFAGASLTVGKNAAIVPGSNQNTNRPVLSETIKPQITKYAL